MTRLEQLTDTERLTEALVLAITAPVGRTAEADALARQFASYCTAEQIEDAQAAALAIMALNPELSEARSCV